MCRTSDAWKSEKTVLDIALEYGYSSHEAFTRTFKQVWNCNPKEFRKTYKYSELFPKYYGMTAGDFAIIESLQRLNREAGKEDFVFRIGADEIVMLTDRIEEAYANAVAERLKSHNGESFEYEGKQIPLSLHVGITRLKDESVRYKDLFNRLHDVISEVKESR